MLTIFVNERIEYWLSFLFVILIRPLLMIIDPKNGRLELDKD